MQNYTVRNNSVTHFTCMSMKVTVHQPHTITQKWPICLILSLKYILHQCRNYCFVHHCADTEHRLLSHTYTLEAVSSLKAHSSFQRHKIKKYKQRLETWDTGAILQDSAVGHVLPVPLYTLGSMLGYKTCLWHCPGGPVVKTVLPMQGCRGHGFNPSSGK